MIKFTAPENSKTSYIELYWTHAHALTYPADTRESDPSTTPPLNSMAMMVVYKQKETCSELLRVYASGAGVTRHSALYSLRFSPPRTTTRAPCLPTCWCTDSGTDDSDSTCRTAEERGGGGGLTSLPCGKIVCFTSSLAFCDRINSASAGLHVFLQSEIES